jgi:hypothetical protein
VRSLVRIHPRAPLFAGLLALATLVFYGLALSRQPIGPDEARVISAAQQLPDAPALLINAADRWLQPLHVYATTTAHAAAPGFFAGRWASVVISAINVGLIFLVAWRLFGGYLAAFAAAAVLMLMPAHMLFGRQGIDAIAIVPFVLLWLYAVLGFLANDRPSAIAAASVALGAGVYTTPSAPLTMAFLFVTMVVVLWCVGRRKVSTLLTAGAAFAAMLLPLAIWFALNPQTYLDTYGSWAIHPAHIRNPIDLAHATVNSNTLGTRASAYWGLLDPSFLFFSSAEGRAPLHWITAPLIVLGIYRCATRRSPASILVLAATIVAPLAGASFGQPHYVANALALLPCLALLAGYGVAFVRELITGPPPPPPAEEY